MSRRIILLLGILLYTVCPVAANHLFGGEINYKFVSATGNRQVYEVTLSLFADCSANLPEGGAFASLPFADPLVYLYKGNSMISALNLTYDVAASNREITPVCPDERNNTTCVNINNPLPGIRIFVYHGTFVLDGLSDEWRFAFRGAISTSPLSASSAGRSLIIQNVDLIDPLTASVSLMYLEATLNNIAGPNSSTTYTSLPTAFFCLNKPSTYSLGAADPENDQLVFSLVPALSVVDNPPPLSTPVTYVFPYSAQQPLPVVPGSFNFSSTSGQMNFIPNLARNCVVANLVEEYRNGVRVGSSMREMTFVILNNCANEVPESPVSGIRNADVAADASGNLQLRVCEGQTAGIAFDINSSDPDGDNISISYSNLPEGAVVTVDSNGTADPVVHFAWDVIDAAPGNYMFYITYTDDGCPLVSTKTVAYTVQIVPHVYEFGGASLSACSNAPDGAVWAFPLTASGIDYEYRWTDAAGNTLQQRSSATGDTLSGIPPGTYKVYIRNSEGCGRNLVFTVDALPAAAVRLANDTVLCEGMPLRIGTEVQEGVQYTWNTADTGCCILARSAGAYVLTGSNRCGSVSDSMIISAVKCNFCLFIPNAFTPNGDGLNDRFRLLETCLLQKFKLQVFNRWGQLVFTSLSITNSWDGSYKGNPAEAGVYYYSITAEPADLSKGTISVKGDVTLIR